MRGAEVSKEERHFRHLMASTSQGEFSSILSMCDRALYWLFFPLGTWHLHLSLLLSNISREGACRVLTLAIAESMSEAQHP